MVGGRQVVMLRLEWRKLVLARKTLMITAQCQKSLLIVRVIRNESKIAI